MNYYILLTETPDNHRLQRTWRSAKFQCNNGGIHAIAATGLATVGLATKDQCAALVRDSSLDDLLDLDEEGTVDFQVWVNNQQESVFDVELSRNPLSVPVNVVVMVNDKPVAVVRSQKEGEDAIVYLAQKLKLPVESFSLANA